MSKSVEWDFWDAERVRFAREVGHEFYASGDDDSLAKVIALANHMLSDVDARKITRHTIWLLRKMREHAQIDAMHPGALRFEREYEAFVAALESQLPPAIAPAEALRPSFAADPDQLLPEEGHVQNPNAYAVEITLGKGLTAKGREGPGPHRLEPGESLVVKGHGSYQVSWATSLKDL